MWNWSERINNRIMQKIGARYITQEQLEQRKKRVIDYDFEDMGKVKQKTIWEVFKLLFWNKILKWKNK